MAAGHALAAAMLLAVVAGASAADEVIVNFYSEAFCPDCQHFTTTTLKRFMATPDINKIMNFTDIPFGNAQVVGNKFQCQHGPSECVGNTLECCAIKYNPSVEKWWPFFLCMEEHGDNMLQYTQQCANLAGIDYYQINKCANGPIGHQCELEAAKNTVNHKWVPWVTINGVHLDNTKNILWQTCQDYKGSIEIEACKDPVHYSDDDIDDDNQEEFQSVDGVCWNDWAPKKRLR